MDLCLPLVKLRTPTTHDSSKFSEEMKTNAPFSYKKQPGVEF